MDNIRVVWFISYIHITDEFIVRRLRCHFVIQFMIFVQCRTYGALWYMCIAMRSSCDMRAEVLHDDNITLVGMCS